METHFTVKVIEDIEGTLIYSLIDMRSGQRVLSCLQDLSASDIFVFTVSENINSLSLMDFLDGQSFQEFRGIALSNFLENECTLRLDESDSPALCLMRYQQFTIPGHRPQLSVALRTLPMPSQAENENATSLDHILNMSSRRSFGMPVYERILRFIGLSSIFTCVTYKAIDTYDFVDDESVYVLSTHNVPSNSGDMWGLNLAMHDELPDELATDSGVHIDFPLQIIQVHLSWKFFFQNKLIHFCLGVCVLLLFDNEVSFHTPYNSSHCCICDL